MEILTDDLARCGERITRARFPRPAGAGLGSLALGALLEPRLLQAASRRRKRGRPAS